MCAQSNARVVLRREILMSKSGSGTDRIPFTSKIIAVLSTLAFLSAGAEEHSVTTESEKWTPQPCIPKSIRVPDVKDMTLDEKIGQMTLVDHRWIVNATLRGGDIEKYSIGCIFSGGGGHPYWGNTAVTWADLMDHIQTLPLATRLKIPILTGVDAVHGHGNLYGATLFPHHIGLGATHNPVLVKEIAIAAALEVAATGIRWAYAPAVSLCLDPRWGRCYESFGEDTDLVTALSMAELEGWQTPADEHHVPGDFLMAATVKHFIGDGGTEGGVDRGDVLISEEELRRVHLPPFVEAMKRDAQTVMISYSSFQGVKMHANRYLITDVLKGELGFQGVVSSDFEGIMKMDGAIEENVRTAINAGIDTIMIGQTYAEFISILKEEVAAGRVLESRIDDAVRRILELKRKLGLFENACARRHLMSRIGSPTHRALGRQAVRESIVLLKNERRGTAGGTLFPLPRRGAKILVAGSHANDLGLQCGGWTLTAQGMPGNNTVGTTILEGILKAVKGEEGEEAEVQYVANPDGSEKADYGIVVVGEIPYAEYHGDDLLGLNLNYTAMDVLTTVCKNMPCVVVLVAGRPLQVSDWLPSVDVLVTAWLPGTEGDGVAEALFGPDDFKGRLPVSWFEDASQLPLSADRQPYNPLFPIGFGLSKTGNPLAEGGGAKKVLKTSETVTFVQ